MPSRNSRVQSNQRQGAGLRSAGTLGVLLAIWAAGALACSFGGAGTGREATVAAISTALVSTATAGVESSATARIAPQFTEAVATNENVLNEAATQAARQSTQLAARAATATAIAPILAELPAYGVDPSHGEVGWIHPPVTLDIEGFEQFAYANQFLATVATDFVVAADITWNTRFGTSGCGVVLRSDGNEDALNQYLVIATRGANGHVIFMLMQAGEVVEYDDLYARGLDPKFTSANDTTNRLAVVGRGTTFSIYTNGTLLGHVEDDHYDRGFVALVALNQSGTTTCQFANTWLWRITQ